MCWRYCNMKYFDYCRVVLLSIAPRCRPPPPCAPACRRTAAGGSIVVIETLSLDKEPLPPSCQINFDRTINTVLFMPGWQRIVLARWEANNPTVSAVAPSREKCAITPADLWKAELSSQAFLEAPIPTVPPCHRRIRPQLLVKEAFSPSRCEQL